MERALDTELLSLALGEHSALPSAEEVSSLIARAELALLLGNPEVDETLKSTGWYLHGVASSKYALRVYGLDRQRAAFRVAAHIFDLTTKSQDLNSLDKLKYGFGSQIAYLHSELDPNAIAVYQQEFSANLPEISLLEGFQELSLSCGIAFLGFDVGYIFSVTRIVREEVDSLVQNWDVADIFSTPFGSAAGVALATRAMMTFLIYGRTEALDRARELLQNAIFSESSTDDQISRWVAAHLLNLFNNLAASSVWSILPSDVPPSVKRAFVMGKPRVLTLWPPQIDLLSSHETGHPSPLSDHVKRLFLSMPTSSGKTLFAQLLVAAHLATQNTSVYYVAPTKSLCREIRVALESRLRYLGRVITDGLPEGDWLAELISPEPYVEVMTPERLSFLLRSDSNRVLNEVGLFIFDEVHNLADQTRGWTLEEDISYLHYRTSGNNHRIVALSAAVGNKVHIIQWMGKDNNNVFERSPDWRGPRRMHAIFTSDVDWDTVSEIPPKSKKSLKRLSYPVFGRLDVRIAQNDQDAHLRTSEPVGVLVQKVRADNTKEVDQEQSTPFYQTLIPTIQHLARTGSVLIIESTRPATVRMARAIANAEPEGDQSRIKPLLHLVEARLGNQHPLWQVLLKGVAYHHGSLPSEIRIAIEEAVTAGYINYLVATTTMTEGVNLPVKSVVIAEQGAYGPEGYTEYITGSKLINAIGRAGRATKETEGIIVLARHAKPKPEDFDRLNPKIEELQVLSILATKKALAELAIFEEAQRTNEDALFQIATGAVSDFISFVWFLVSELEALRSHPVNLDQIETALQFTLAWVQLEPDNREKWGKLTDMILHRYHATDTSTRQRWATSGTSMTSASRMEIIAASLANSAKTTILPEEPVEVIRLILHEGRLEQMLSLPEAPKRTVYAQRAGKNRTIVAVSLEKLLIEWIQGLELNELANSNLSLVPDIDFRFEQLGDLINEYFETFFPWVFGTIISWTNQMLTEEGILNLFPKAIPAFIRWGIGNTSAAELISKGLPSRTLAVRITKEYLSAGSQEDVFTWLQSLNLTQWQQKFSASQTELRLLLDFCRSRKGGAVAELINNGSTSITVDTEISDFESSHVTISPLENTDIATLGIWTGDSLVGRILTKDQYDLQTIFSLGLDYNIDFSVKSGSGSLQINLLTPDI